MDHANLQTVYARMKQCLTLVNLEGTPATAVANPTWSGG